MKKGLLLLLILCSVFVAAAPSGCEPTNIPSYKQYVDSNVKRVWDSYSAQSAGVCAFATGVMPKGGDCKFSVQLTEGGFTKYLCWYGDSTVPAPARPSACEPTHLPSYKQYVDSKVKSAWDSYSAQTEGVCAYHPPARPEGGKCTFTVELFEGNQPMWLCWYGKKIVDESKPINEAPLSPVKKGLWERFKGFFGLGTGKFPYSVSDAQREFEKEVISKSQLPQGWYAMMYPKLVSAGTEIQDGHFNSMIVEEDALFGWLEPFPDLMYGHPTFFMILFADGTVEVYQGNANAVVAGEDIREVGKRFGSGSPTGGVVGLDVDVPIGITGGVVGFASHDVESDGSRVRMKPNVPQDSGLGAGGADQLKGAKRCPPGYVEKKVPAKGEERAVAIAIVDDKEPKIKLVDDARRFLAATSAAGFEDGGMLTTIPAAIAKIKELSASLEEPSTFALFISTHGSPVWKVTLRNPRTGETQVIDRFMGMDARPGMVGLPQGWDVVSKEQVSLCVGLNNQCLTIKGDDFAAFKSCRKFVGSSACFSGILTNHNVPGLSVYAGSQADRPGLAVNGISLFGNAFTTALAGAPPIDPKNPDDDEPKPEFDAAFAAAASSIAKNPAQGRTLRIPLGQQTIVWRYDQQAVSKSVEGKKNCKSAIECVPLTGLPPENPPPFTDPGRTDGGAGCEGLKARLGEVPFDLKQMMEGGANYPYDRLQVFAGAIQYADLLKACYKCPPNTSPFWKGCTPPDGWVILDSIISQLRSLASKGDSLTATDVMNVKRLIDEFMKCELKCRPMTGMPPPPTGVGVIPSGTSAARPTCETLGAFTEEVPCRRSCQSECRRVPGSFVNAKKARELNIGSTRCWICEVKDSILDDIEETGYIPSAGTTQPVAEPQTAPQPVDCESFCASKGMSMQKPSSSSILQQLQQYRCVSGASIKMSSASGQGCVCYGQPRIQINSQPPVCQSACGPVPCDGSLSCSCGERCTLTVRCIWGGWKEIKEFTYQPVLASST